MTKPIDITIQYNSITHSSTKSHIAQDAKNQGKTKGKHWIKKKRHTVYRPSHESFWQLNVFFERYLNENGLGEATVGLRVPNLPDSWHVLTHSYERIGLSPQQWKKKHSWILKFMSSLLGKFDGHEKSRFQIPLLSVSFSHHLLTNVSVSCVSREVDPNVCLWCHHTAEL